MYDIYICQDAERAAVLFTNKLNTILDEMAPVRKIQIRSRYAPWVTSECKEDMDSRDAAQKKAIVSGFNRDWDYIKIISVREIQLRCGATFLVGSTGHQAIPHLNYTVEPK